MTTITITGTHQDPDSTFPDGTVLKAALKTDNMFSGGSFINQHQVSTAIDDTDGTFSLTLQVPDDAGQAALYTFALPDGEIFNASVSSGSATDWETFVANATDDETYDADTLALYMPKSGGTFTGLITLSGAPTADLHASTKKYVDDNIDTAEYIVIACSDETSDLETGTAKATFRVPYALTLSAVRASVTTAPTGSAIQVDINESGTTILSTKLTIDANEKTSQTAATPPVISDSALADDAEITVDIDAVGSTTAGAGLKVYLIGAR